jgi:hypothetical protein
MFEPYRCEGGHDRSASQSADEQPVAEPNSRVSRLAFVIHRVDVIEKETLFSDPDVSALVTMFASHPL